MAWLLICGTIVIGILLLTIFITFQNYRLAVAARFPIQICVSNGNDPIFLIGNVAARRFFKRLPWPLSMFGQYSFYGWTYDDYMEGNTHDRLGPIWFVVSPLGNEMIVADPETALTLTAKWKIFQKPPAQQALALFGPNLDTVEGNDWNKHRRLTAPCFNERSSESVWEESRSQAVGMLKKFELAGKSGVQSVAEDTQALALHVLTKVAFGMQNSFDSGVKAAPGYTLSFQRAIQLIIRNLIPCVIFGSKLCSPIMPGYLREAGQGFVEYDRYVQDIVDREKAKLTSGNDTSNNLISVLLRAVDTDEHRSESAQAGGAFTEADVKGNCFIFTVAGHDTTANSLALAIALLSARPHIQEWLADEIDAIIGDDEPDYETHFPRLVRCQAALYETLRLYPAVPELPKHTGGSYVPITVNGKEHVLPPQLYIRINITAIQRLKKYWGSDADEWRPERWITTSATPNPNNSGTISKAATTNHRQETIKEPHRGTYMPWAEGPRICPGNKFARTEFVATIVTLFRKHTVKPMPVAGENEVQARERTIEWAKDCHAAGVALNLRRPEDVTLVWEYR